MFPSPAQYGEKYPMRVTYSLMAANVVVYVALQVGGTPLYGLLAQTGSQFFAGAYWQLFTALFVHFDIFHIGFNMIALYYFGRLNEISYSEGEYLAIYFGAGLLGNVVSLFLIPMDVQTGGASGAIFGLVGSYAARNRNAMNIALALVYAAFILLESSGPGVNIYAHLFGVAGGFALGMLFTRMRPPE
ncbi:MAG TPA: rhomboid family intramembrane serine protease [Nitrososphaerales archaeon]|nr:rhomboid family intramembrane serine protease [Nitrososphaerales archaeon]